jgi:hypothetical protein
MSETPFPSDELVFASERMNSLDARGKLGVALEFGMETPSFSSPANLARHWDTTQVIVGEAARQITRDGQPEERLGEMLHDSDDRISTLLLAGISMRLPYISLSSKAGNLIVETVPTHPSRRFREAGIVFLESTGMLRPTPAVIKMRVGQMRRDDVTEEEFARRRILKPIKWACVEEASDAYESPLFSGQTQRWQLEHAFPIMALLWYSGHVEMKDLACIDPNQTELESDLHTLSDLGEVETRSVRKGRFGEQQTVFALTKPEFWAGPPW